MTGQRIGLAGASGMIGAQLAAIYGDRAVALPRELTGGGEARDDESVRRTAAFLRDSGVGLLVNAVGTAVKSWPALLQANVLVASRLARAASQAGAAYVSLGSTRVFDAAVAVPRQETDVPDLPGLAAVAATPASETPPAGIDLYGASKWLGEQCSREAMGPGRWYVLRLPMVLGIRRGDMESQIVTRLYSRARSGRPVRAAIDVMAQAVSPTAVARGVSALWESGAPAGVYHLPSLGHASLHAIVTRFFTACRLPPPGEAVNADFEPDAPGPRWQVLAPGRLATLTPPEPWEKAVDRFASCLCESKQELEPDGAASGRVRS